MAEEWTISVDAYDRRVEEANDAGARASQLEPRRANWGLYAYGDAPGGIGGGTGLFEWFKTKSDLLDFVKRHLAFAWPGRTDIDPGRVASQVQNLIEAIGSDPPSEVLEATRVELNMILRTFSHVEWWGSFEDLLEGTHPYATTVRAWFRSGAAEGDRTAGRPISTNEVADFRAALHEYGI